MKVNFNTLSMPEYGISYSRAYAPSIYNVNAGNDVFVRECKKPAAIVSFGSAAGTERTVLWLGAEISDIKTKGGVATVMHDYLDFPGTKNIMGIPYHNGYITYDYITGEIVDVGSIIKDNQPVYTNENLKTVSIDNLKDNQFFKLEEIASKEMMWSEEKVPIKLYQIFDKNGKAAPIYSVYTERLALMNEAYADSSYSSGIEIKKIKGEQPRAFRGTAYGQFNKAALELLPELALKQGIKFDHIVASDDQCGFLSEYLQQFREYGAYEGFYNKITSSHIGHNIGKGYVNGMSLRDMLVNLGLTIEDAKILRECPQYQAAVLAGPEEEGKWLAENIFSGLECAPSSATEVALLSTKYGTSQRFDVVSELYAKAVAQNPRIAELPIHKLFKELYVTGIAGGILNPLNDPSVAPDKPIKFPGFSKPLEILADGTAKFAEGDITGKTIVEAFETYNFKPDATPEEAFEQMKSIKY
ncbi:MAG: hypothetical protein LBJ74_00080, partial [Heliobacteriaceae bacterium]|nr:hypothetical protein [Heliobacteriaceae bacterium]